MRDQGHEIYYIEGFEIVAPYTLHVTFQDGSQQTVNLEPVLHGELFGPLRDINIFNQVRLAPEIRNLVWPNDAAFDPETLRNWPKYEDEFIEMAHRWEQVVV